MYQYYLQVNSVLFIAISTYEMSEVPVYCVNREVPVHKCKACMLVGVCGRVVMAMLFNLYLLMFSFIADNGMAVHPKWSPVFLGEI